MALGAETDTLKRKVSDLSALLKQADEQAEGLTVDLLTAHAEMEQFRSGLQSQQAQPSQFARRRPAAGRLIETSCCARRCPHQASLAVGEGQPAYAREAARRGNYAQVAHAGRDCDFRVLQAQPAASLQEWPVAARSARPAATLSVLPEAARCREALPSLPNCWSDILRMFLMS